MFTLMAGDFVQKSEDFYSSHGFPLPTVLRKHRVEGVGYTNLGSIEWVYTDLEEVIPIIWLKKCDV